MKRIILITGGQRSGKSSYAEQLALSLSPTPVYVATARVWDEEFRQRVLHHQAFAISTRYFRKPSITSKENRMGWERSSATSAASRWLPPSVRCSVPPNDTSLY